MRTAWVPVAAHSPFPLTNLPYGVFTTADRPQHKRIGVAIGDLILEVGPIATHEGLPWAATLSAPNLNAFMATGPEAWQELRRRLTTWLTDVALSPLVEPHLVPRSAARMHLAFEVGDYVDFFASEAHATRLGEILRPGQPPLFPNWKYLPAGYHGRSGTVCVSGTPVRRPSGQTSASKDGPPTFGATRRLDFEAEVGFIVGVPSAVGEPVPLDAFADHVFGVCLVNDWSARDLQAWEYAPLGPFLGKSFLTSLSPWIVPLVALDAARVAAPPRDVEVLPYLDGTGCRDGFDITLEVRLNGQVLSRLPFRDMYWTAAQQLAHLTVNGAALRTGDLYASGTVSGRDRHQSGSLIELTWNATEPIVLDGGAVRGFLEDGDDVVITASAPGAHATTIGFGEVQGLIVTGGDSVA